MGDSSAVGDHNARGYATEALARLSGRAAQGAAARQALGQLVAARLV
jgi:hypothetical protein